MSAVHVKRDWIVTVQLITARILLVGIVANLWCGSANAQDKRQPKEKPQPKAQVQKDAPKIEARNNAASLLADLLGDEKNVSKLLVIKGNSEDLGRLIKTISQAAGDGEKQLEAMAKNDPTLNLRSLRLPPGEKATRDAIAKTKTRDLLFSSGEKFEFNLLLSQAQALSYASHLAKIAADNSPSAQQKRAFHALDVQFGNLFDRVIAKMRGGPSTT